MGLGIKPGLLEVACTVSGWFSFAPPAVMFVIFTVCDPESSLIVRLLMVLKVGGSFTGLTVKTKLVLLVLVPSLTLKVIWAIPDWLAAGVMVTVRLAPLPPKEIFPFGTRPRVPELPDIDKLPGGVSRSSTTTISGPKTPSSVIV